MAQFNRLSIIIALLSKCVYSAYSEPTFTFSAGRVTARPPIGGQANHQQIEILNTIDCAGNIQSHDSLLVPHSCPYLYGVYRNFYQTEEGQSKEAVTSFAVSSSLKASLTFMVGQTSHLDK